MERRFIYIINPISGTKQKQQLQHLVEEKTYLAGFEFEIYPSVANGDYSFLHDTITEKKITDVIVAGGDGTVNAVVYNLRKFDLQFGILPLGSGNGLAFSAGIPKSIDGALQVIFDGKAILTDAFLINDSFACMLCGVGFDAQVAHDFANDPKRGLTTYIRKTISNFFSAEAYPFSIAINDVEIELEAFFISIANSNQFGNNFTIAPKASLNDGLLDIVIVTKQNKMNWLLQTIKQVTGFNELQQIELINKNASVIYFQASALKIFNLQSAPMHIDGDPVITAEEINVQVIKQAFKLIAP